MIIVFLPAYNEEQAIGALLDRIREALASESYRVLLVDDGSKDRTVAIAREKAAAMPIEIVARPKNGGLGAALSDGFLYAAEHYSDRDLLVTMDADNTFDPALIHEMKKEIAAGADIVIASRYVSGAKVIGVSFFRRFLSHVISGILTLVFHGKNVRDYTSGYRCFRISLIRRVTARFKPFLRAGGFAATMEILIKALSENAVCREIPFTLRYDLKQGGSKIRLTRTIVEYIRLIILIRGDIVRTGKK